MWTTLKRNPQYAVNEQGEIYSLRKGRTLIPKVNHDGYLRIQLWSANQCEYVSIHRLIAETFIPNPHGKPFVNHIDGNKQNNRVENLEWCTQQENIAHAWKNGLSRSRFNICGKPVRQINLKRSGDSTVRFHDGSRKRNKYSSFSYFASGCPKRYCRGI